MAFFCFRLNERLRAAVFLPNECFVGLLATCSKKSYLTLLVVFLDYFSEVFFSSFHNLIFAKNLLVPFLLTFASFASV